MKRIVSLILALSMVLSMFTMSFAGLKDVEGTDYEAAVEALIELGVVTGYPDGTYLPEKVVTRAELAKLLVIAYGLEPAAEASKGATAFSDIGAEHWASGYVNVSADYKFVNGYPEGTFKGDATVTYAEAITMCLRVLGYANEIDAKGTWPTNYIAKAQDLKLMDGIKFDSYNDGAKRGNVALLIWNMLTTKMWEVQGESEGDGLEYKPQREMIEVKFNDYKYFDLEDHVKFGGYTIDEDKKEELPVVYMNIDGVNYEYAGNDFYTFVPGTEVEALINTKEKTLLTMVPTSDNKLVDGAKDEIDDNYAELSGDNYDYAYVRVEKSAIKDAVALSTTSIYVDKVEAKDTYVKVNDVKKEDKVWDYALVLKDGERVNFKEALEVGDILTTVTVLNGRAQTFYVIGSSEVEGKFVRYSEVKYENSAETYLQLIIDDEKLVADAAATFVEDPEAKTIKALALADHYKPEMEKEEIVAYVDAVFGKVVRINFDGKIDAGNDDNTSVKFFGVVNTVDRDGLTYFMSLENEAESDNYNFLRNSAVESTAKSMFANGVDLTGRFIAATLNDNNEIEAYKEIARWSGDSKVTDTAEIPYGDEASEKFVLVSFPENSYNKEEKAFSGDSSLIKVNDSTVVVKVVFDDKGTTKNSDDEYRVEFAEGMVAVEDVKNEAVIVIYDADSSFIRAKYVVVFSDTSTKTDKEVAKVANAGEKVIVGGQMVELEDANGEEITAKLASGTTISGDELVVYTLTETSNGDKVFNKYSSLTVAELNSGDVTHKYVGECLTDRVFLLDDNKAKEIDIDSETYADAAEESLFVVVTVTSTDVEGQFEVSEFSLVSFEEVSLTEGDRIFVKGDVAYIVTGMPIRTK